MAAAPVDLHALSAGLGMAIPAWAWRGMGMGINWFRLRPWVFQASKLPFALLTSLALHTSYSPSNPSCVLKRICLPCSPPAPGVRLPELEERRVRMNDLAHLACHPTESSHEISVGRYPISTSVNPVRVKLLLFTVPWPGASRSLPEDPGRNP